MDDLKSILENDKPLLALLGEHDSISYNGNDWIVWKERFASVIEDYSDEELQEVYHWCILILQTNLEEHLKTPIPPFYNSNRGGISQMMTNPEQLENRKQNISIGYKKRIRHFKLFLSKL